jgi:hypothetical protein
MDSQPKTEDGKIEVPVICATRDYQGAVAETIATLWNTLWAMDRSPTYCQFMSHGYAFVRANVFKGLKDTYGRDVIRGFMIDDDILLKSNQQANLKLAIETADKFHWNFVSPYRVRDGYVAIARENGMLMSVEEVKGFATFDRVPNAGLGFYYGDLPLSYHFHEEGVYGGEDLNFFYENPQLDLRMVDLKLQHLKMYNLTLETPIPYIVRPLSSKGAPLKTREELGIPEGEPPRIQE